MAYESSPGGVAVEHPDGTKVLVLGLVSILLCTLLGPFVWAMGNKAEAEVKAGRYAESSTLKIGKILGMVATGFLVLGLLFAVFVLVAGVGLSA